MGARFVVGRGRLQVPIAMVVVLAACGGSSGGTAGETTADTRPRLSSSAASTSAASTSAASTAIPPTSASTAGEHQPVAYALQQVLLPLQSGAPGLPSPEPACFERALNAANPAVERAADQLVQDPPGWQSLPDQDVHPLVQAYLGCADSEAVLEAIARNGLRTTDAPPCVAAAWAEAGLTIEPIVDSLVYGTSRDDLPDPLVDDLIAGAALCLPDQDWWVESLAIVLNQQGLAPEEAECVAAAYVATVGVERLIRHRILSIPELALPASDQAALDLGARCGFDVPWPWGGIPATALGECVADLYVQDRPAVVVPCDQPHDVEIFAIKDLSSDLTKWPGFRGLAQQTSRFCEADATDAIAGRPELSVVKYQMSRQAWVMGNRRVACAIGHADGQPWTGPSGVLVVPSAVEFRSLVAGQCISHQGLLDGTIDGVVDVVDCRSPHDAEVFFASDLPQPPGAPYPGDRGASDLTSTECVPAFDAFVGRAWTATALGTWFFYPSEQSWNEGDRRMTCYLYDGSKMTDSAAGSRR